MKPSTKHSTTTTTTTTIVAVAAAVVLLPGLLAGCSGAPSTDSTDTASGGGKGAGASLASCMRDHGYDMPDPSSGGSTLSLSAPDGIDDEQWKADLQECMGDAGAGEGFQAAKPAGTPEQRKQIAECIRENGFADYPDGDDAMSTYRPDDQDAFQDASSTCFDEVLGKGGSSGSNTTVQP